MKGKTLSGLFVFGLLVVCNCFPAHAGNVTVTNNCGQDVDYQFYNNGWFGSWSLIGSGTVPPTRSAGFQSDDMFRCVVLVKVQWREEETYGGGKWNIFSDDPQKSTEVCPIAGCSWNQCGAAQYSFDPVDGPTGDPKAGDTRKCKLTTK